MSTVRIAIIGAGLIGRTHINVIRQEWRCEVAAIADPMPAAAVYASEQGIPLFADYAEMLDLVKPDGAIIATPNALHAPAALACAERGVPMLVEKPIADTIEAAHNIVDAADHAGVALLVGHHRRYNPILQKSRDIVQSGRIGRLVAVNSLYLLQKPDPYFDVAWRREAGGGPVLINLIHDIDDLRFICGEISILQAISSNSIRGFAVEDTAAIIARFANGALGTLTVSDATATPWNWEMTVSENPFFPRQPENCYYFAGTEGGFAVPKMELWHYAGEKGWGAPFSRETIDVQPTDPYVQQIRHFCRVILGEEKPFITGADAARTLAATLAIKKAAETGSSVKLQ